jgi:hypothetical protein
MLAEEGVHLVLPRLVRVLGAEAKEALEELDDGV